MAKMGLETDILTAGAIPFLPNHALTWVFISSKLLSRDLQIFKRTFPIGKTMRQAHGLMGQTSSVSCFSCGFGFESSPPSPLLPLVLPSLHLLPLPSPSHQHHHYCHHIIKLNLQMRQTVWWWGCNHSMLPTSFFIWVKIYLVIDQRRENILSFILSLSQ